MELLTSSWSKKNIISAYELFVYGSYTNESNVKPNEVFETSSELRQLIYGGVLAPDVRKQRTKAVLYALELLHKFKDKPGDYLELNFEFYGVYTHIEMTLYDKDKVSHGMVFDLNLIDELGQF